MPRVCYDVVWRKNFTLKISAHYVIAKIWRALVTLQIFGIFAYIRNRSLQIDENGVKT